MFLLDAIIEREMCMIDASQFWLSSLHGCRIDRTLPLPFDRHRSSNEYRTGRGKTVSFDFGSEISQNFIRFASENNTKLDFLALSVFYAFLFKLTNGERDLCVVTNTDGRYKSELYSLVGMFVNAIPLRCQIDPHWSFSDLVHHVHLIMTRYLEYAYFPLQHILAQHPQASKPRFLDTSFEFRSIANDQSNTRLILGDVSMMPVPHSIKIGATEIVSKFDFSLNIEHDQTNSRLSCIIDASLDLFNEATIEKIGQQFMLVLEQLFITNVSSTTKPIYELSLILPSDTTLIESINKTHVNFTSIDCLHHRFAQQANTLQQKLAVELDEQCLTYSELLSQAQNLALYLLETYSIKSGEIICQCVERSITMVSNHT